MIDVSFIIITDGKKKDKLLLQVNSILLQKISNFEIIIVGEVSDLHFDLNNIILAEDKEGAETGSLGKMRNKACHVAQYDYIVVSDDDMLFSLDWYRELNEYKTDFDILTPCVKLPDGTRFWDHCCYMSPTHGHVILNPYQEDDHLYMSGGQSWIMKWHVWARIQWDESILIYSMKNLIDYKAKKHNEDTDFALRCRKAGFKIRHNPKILVYHNDKTYTSIGRMTRRRSEGRGPEWCKDIVLKEGAVSEQANTLFQKGLQAEAIDLLRKTNQTKHLDEIENQFGGQLDNSCFTFDNIHYQGLVDVCR